MEEAHILRGHCITMEQHILNIEGAIENITQFIMALKTIYFEYAVFDKKNVNMQRG